MRKMIDRRGAAKMVHVKKRLPRDGGFTVVRLSVKDGYQGNRYQLERLGTQAFSAGLERYLRRRPELTFDHPNNRARRALQLMPVFSAWAKLMPDSLALEPMHHPELSGLASGEKIDFLMRRMFRHALDAIGIRTRTVVGAWLTEQYVREQNLTSLTWTSLAGGTAAPGFLMLAASGLPASKCRLQLADLDPVALKIAAEIAQYEGMKSTQLKTLEINILRRAELIKKFGAGGSDVVEMMGIFEYLNDRSCVQLLQTASSLVKTDGLILLANMRRKHKQINLSKRGAGWPGVKPRSAEMVVTLIRRAFSEQKMSLEIYQPTDGAYNVFVVKKSA
ncbi:MAG: hypothetical protein ACREGA_00380 [Candidatus Saccharimonadales bacterium]